MLFVKKAILFVSSISVLLAPCSPVSDSDRINRRESMLSGMFDFIRSGREDAAPQEEEQKDSEIYVNVYFHREDEIRRMPLDDYITGVVCGEVPESYPKEALKAQAIAARSYAVYRIENNILHSNGADVCTNYAHCQAWSDAEDGAYPEAVAEAVEETHNIIGVYDGKCINALYFSNSGGYTESIENVWEGPAVPYLTGVESPGESEYYDYCDIKYFTAEAFASAVCEYTDTAECSAGDPLSSIADIRRSESGRIISACVAGKELSGLKVREMLGARSSNIYFEHLPDGSVVTVSLGYGHGVGMSQCGARAMALGGAGCEEILKHYYTGISLVRTDGDSIRHTAG